MLAVCDRHGLARRQAARRAAGRGPQRALAYRRTWPRVQRRGWRDRAAAPGSGVRLSLPGARGHRLKTSSIDARNALGRKPPKGVGAAAASRGPSTALRPKEGFVGLSCQLVVTCQRKLGRLERRGNGGGSEGHDARNGSSPSSLSSPPPSACYVVCRWSAARASWTFHGTHDQLGDEFSRGVPASLPSAITSESGTSRRMPTLHERPHDKSTKAGLPHVSSRMPELPPLDSIHLLRRE